MKTPQWPQCARMAVLAELQPGESHRVTITADPRLLGTFDEHRRRWLVPAGGYQVRLGRSAGELLQGAERAADGFERAAGARRLRRGVMPRPGRPF